MTSNPFTIAVAVVTYVVIAILIAYISGRLGAKWFAVNALIWPAIPFWALIVGLVWATHKFALIADIGERHRGRK